MYTAKRLREALLSIIRILGRSLEYYARNPGKDFTRKRMMTFEKLVFSLLTMNENSIGANLINYVRAGLPQE